MADHAKDWALGEYLDDAELVTCELTEALAEADYGSVWKVTGINAAGQLKVAKGTANALAHFIAVRGKTGASGDLVGMLRRGTVKVKFAAAISAGGTVSHIGDVVSANSGSGANTHAMGFLHGPDVVANDTGLVFWRGP